MKKVLSLIFILIIGFTATGCQDLWPRMEINDLTIVRVLGIDKTENGLRISITNVKPGNAIDISSSANYLVSEGKTISEAMENLNMSSTKRPFWAFLEYIIISEDLAKAGLEPYLDIFIREYDLRLNINVFLLRGNTCEEVIVKSIDKQMYLSNYFKELINGTEFNSLSSQVTLADIANTLSNERMSVYIPVIYMSPNNMMNIKTDNSGSSSQGTEEAASDMEKESASSETEDVKKSEEKNVWFLLEGYAIFKGGILHAYTDKEETLGINILINEYKTGIITIDDKNGDNISLRVIQLQISQKPVVDKDNNRYSIDASVEVDCNVTEYMGNENIFEYEYIEYISQKVNAYIKKCINKAIKFVHDNKTDCIKTGELFRLYKPYDWEKIKTNWLEVNFSRIEYDVEVKTIVKRSYSVLEPNTTGGK